MGFSVRARVYLATPHPYTLLLWPGGLEVYF
jgi:hypothetical protein